MRDLKIVADMTADLFHSGHINLLKEARKYFKDANVHLTVALHTDEQILAYKKKLPIMNYACRFEILNACKYVDQVMEAPDDFDENFVNAFDYLVHGDDLLIWDQDLLDRFYKEVMRQEKLVLVPYTKDISTTILRNNASISKSIS